MKILFITRNACTLCDKAEAMLHALRRRFQLDIDVRNVDRDPDLLEEYGDRIPVALSAAQTVLAEGRWNRRRLIAALKEERRSG